MPEIGRVITARQPPPNAAAIMPASPPLLTVCVIARNEERFIAQGLASVAGLADQLVVLDTGSTDRTAELARAAGAEVHHFAWCDDFAAARNAALGHARGRWVLMLDADEELPPDQHPVLREHLADTAAAAFRLPIVNAGEESLGANYVPRLFRNVPGARYVGRIHEQVFPSVLAATQAAGQTAKLGRARLLHHGYTAALTRERDKVERNLRLLRQAVSERPHDANLRLNLGLERVRSGELDGGLQDYAEAFRMLSAAPPADVSPELRETLLTQFATHLLRAGRAGEVEALLASPLARTGNLTASLQLTLGFARWQRREFAGAAESFGACLATRTVPGLTPATADLHTAVPHHFLALCLRELGDVAGAEAAFSAGLATGKKTGALQLDYARHLAQRQQPVEALQQLHQLVSADTQDFAAWHLGGQIALSRPDYLEFALDWTAEAARALPDDPKLREQRAEALFLAQQIEAALPLWETLDATESTPRSLAAVILCRLCSLRPPPPQAPVADAPAVTQAAVAWYRRWLDFQAEASLRWVHSRRDCVRAALPDFARILDAVGRDPSVASSG